MNFTGADINELVVTLTGLFSVATAQLVGRGFMATPMRHL